jgi:hypothetical protein
MSDVYRDTDERYRRDPAFYSAVRTMEAIAREHGFTPGELKQIAFKAAVNIEMTMNRSPLQTCAHCRGPVTGLGTWQSLSGRTFCSRACYVAAGGGP